MRYSLPLIHLPHPPHTATFTRLFNSVNEYLNVLQSVQLPFAMLPVPHSTP